MVPWKAPATRRRSLPRRLRDGRTTSPERASCPQSFVCLDQEQRRLGGRRSAAVVGDDDGRGQSRRERAVGQVTVLVGCAVATPVRWPGSLAVTCTVISCPTSAATSAYVTAVAPLIAIQLVPVAVHRSHLRV